MMNRHPTIQLQSDYLWASFGTSPRRNPLLVESLWGEAVLVPHTGRSKH